MEVDKLGLFTGLACKLNEEKLLWRSLQAGPRFQTPKMTSEFYFQSYLLVQDFEMICETACCASIPNGRYC